MLSLNFLDILCFLASSLSVLSGTISGAVKLSIGFTFFLLSILFAYLIYIPIGEAVSEYISNQFAVNIISICLSYIISALCCGFIAKQLKKLVKDITGGFTDRAMGGIFGVIRGLVLAMIIFLIITILTGKTYVHANNILDLVKPQEEVKHPKWVRKALCYEQMNSMIDGMIHVIGEESLKETKIPTFKGKKKPKQEDFFEKKEPQDLLSAE
jgi:membrane protein required for colicin V production